MCITQIRYAHAICQEAAKEMPAGMFEVDLNPQKVGSDSKPLRGRLQPRRWAERDLLRKGGARRTLLRRGLNGIIGLEKPYNSICYRKLNA